jgi:hypothetical protein
VTRALLGLGVRLLDVLLAAFATHAPATCVAVSMGLDPLRAWTAPPEPPTIPARDLREVYPL